MKFYLVIILVLLASYASAQENLSADSSQNKGKIFHKSFLGDTKEFTETIKQIGKIDWDSHIRTRHEFWNNQETLNDDLDDLYSFTRIKLYLGGGIRFTENIRFYARVVNESRFYGHKGSLDSTVNDHFARRERGYFELVAGQLSFEWNNLLNDRLDMKIGRQNLHDRGFGSQWLLGDGTPLDGSKTFYYNAVRFTYWINNQSTLDFVALTNFAEDPIVIYSENEKTVTNISDEHGGFVWYKNKSYRRAPFDLYYLYKHEDGGGGFQREEVSDIHTLGFHFRPQNDRFWMDAQLAGQWGSYGNASRRGLGTIIYGGVQFKKGRSSLKVGPWYMYLSGDDPNTENFEAFNNLYGGYPNDDELYINTWAKESGTSMWTNINLPGLYLEYIPTPKYNIRFWYHYMRANELMPGDFFGQGKERGHMVMLKAMMEFTKNFKAYYMFEYLAPGDFYFNGADNAILSRVNLEWFF